MTHFCPSCGFNIDADSIEVDGPWEISPLHINYRGQLLDVPMSWRIILHSLIHAGGRPVRKDVLLNRISGPDTAIKVVDVQVCKLRKALGKANPIQTVHGVGYSWKRPDECDEPEVTEFSAPVRAAVLRRYTTEVATGVRQSRLQRMVARRRRKMGSRRYG